MDLLTELLNKQDELRQTIKAMKSWGSKKAEAEKAYKIRLRQEVLKERDKGTAIGVITLIVYGEDEVAKMRLDRDITETMYEACKEQINAIKLEIRVLENQINREYGVEGKQL